MAKKQFEVQHRNHLLAGGSDKMWRIEDIRLSLEGTDECSSAKRTLERWISRFHGLRAPIKRMIRSMS